MQTTVAISNPLPIKPISFHYSLSDPKQKHALFQRATLLKGQPFWVLVLFTWGSLLALNFALAFFKWVYVNFLRPAKTLKKYESWALVTELSGGIGKAFAFQLARKGINMILVSQNPDKLKDVSDSIQAKYSKTQIKIVVVAFAGELSKGVQRISEAIEGLDVGVVINNVGISYPYARYFHEVDEELLKNLIKMNVETMVLRGGLGL